MLSDRCCVVFHSNVKDVHDDLEVAVYSEAKNKSVKGEFIGKGEFVGKIKVPLLRVSC